MSESEDEQRDPDDARQRGSALVDAAVTATRLVVVPSRLHQTGGCPDSVGRLASVGWFASLASSLTAAVRSAAWHWDFSWIENHELKSLIVVAPEHLRAQLRGRSLPVQLARIEQLQIAPAAPVEQRLSVFSLQSIAARVRFLSAQLAELDPQNRLAWGYPCAAGKSRAVR